MSVFYVASLVLVLFLPNMKCLPARQVLFQCHISVVQTQLRQQKISTFDATIPSSAPVKLFLSDQYS